MPVLPNPKLAMDVRSSSVLSQDIITSASILVDSTSAAPVAAFVNQCSGEAEALAVVDKKICHIKRDRKTDSGWRAIPLFGGRAARQVAAGVAYPDTPSSAAYGLFVDDSSQLHASTLGPDGETWQEPKAVPDGLMSHLRVAYSPGGRVVVYGANNQGDLVTAFQEKVGGTFRATVCSVQNSLRGGDFQLCMTDEQSFTIVANVNGAAYVITGELGATESRTGPSPAPQFKGKLTHVALGYWSQVQGSLIFLLVDDSGALHAWSQSGDVTVAQQIPNSTISQATGHVGADGSLHVYAVDKSLGLWVLHQSALQPWREDGAPNWAPFLPLDKGIGRVVSDMNPAAAPSIFVLDGGDSSLRLHAQDATSRMWKCQKVLQHAPQAYEVTRHRVEVRILDANAQALRNHPVTLTVEKGRSAVEVWAGGGMHLVDEQGVMLTTDINGKLTVAIIANENGLACPNLMVSCDGLAAPKIVRPAGALHEYLSGKGTLNPTNPPGRGGGPLPQFENNGATLQAAKVSGKTFAPGASDPKAASDVASAIQHAASFALGNPAPGLHGFGASLRTGATSFEALHTPQALQAYSVKHGLAQAQLGDFWDELKHFFADIFEGIKNLVIEIAHFVVDVAREIVEFTLDFAGTVGKLLHLDISGIEKAASFMHGVFNSVDAGIDKVVQWLEALFDFGAIWRTKIALQKAIEDFNPYLRKLAGRTQDIADGWIARQKTVVNAAFDDAIQKYAGQSYEQLNHWQDPSAPPSDKPIAGGAAPSDFTDNPHHNWLQDKVTSYSPDTSGIALEGSIDDLWAKVGQHFSESASEFQDFKRALDKFQDDIWSAIKDPANFASKAIGDFFEMARDLTLAAIDLLGAVIDAVAALIGTGADLLDRAFKEELPLGFLNTLWKWMAEGAGYPADDKLNLYSLSALLAALPTTLIYKLIEGVDHEPFPEDQIHGSLASGDPVKVPWQSVLTSDIVRILQIIPGFASDFLAHESPGWLTAVNFGFGASIWALRHGYPEQWEEILFALVITGPWVLLPIPRAIAWWRGLHAHDSNDIVAGLSTVYGLFALSYGIYQDTRHNQQPGQAVAIILLPLPSLFGWLTLTPIRLNVELAPFAIGGNFFFDFVGYIGGGAALMYDTLNSRTRLTTSAS